MTTQPSDWAVELLPCPFCRGKAIDRPVSANFWTVSCDVCQTEGPPFASQEEAASHWNTRAPVARELDASGGGRTVQDFIAAMVKAHGYAPALNSDGTLLNGRDEDRYQGWLLATPRAAEAGEWLPIESAPEAIGLCVVYTPDQGGGERFDFDWKEDGVWQEHYNHFEHFMAVGGVNACGPDVACTGPGEQPDYTHYRPLTAPRAAMAALAKP